MPSSDPVETTLERVNARAWGIASGLILGTGLGLATIVLVLKGGEDVGQHLGLLGHVFPGYDVTWSGAVIGFVYAFVLGYALGRLLAPRRALRLARRPDNAGKHVRIRKRAWGLTTGVVLALGILITTNVLILRGGENVGQHLEYLGLYLPGYEVSLAGSLIGAAWLLLAGYAGGWLVGRLYNGMVTRAEQR